ncbi:Putative mutator sub-class protein [Arachis hypogaea]|nr:Putative mutator sub-class protein [Arachis hypogaea]
MPVVAPSCLLAAPSLVLAPAARSPGLITGLVGGGEPDHVEDAMREDDSDDEPDHISGDSEEESPVAPPALQGPSSSGSHQQPPHFSMLNLEAASQQPDDAHIFGYQGLHDGNTSKEFQIGQSFQTKEEAVMSVKDYSIRLGVQYWVMEFDHLKYVGRYKEFGNGCTWMICVAL